MKRLPSIPPFVFSDAVRHFWSTRDQQAKRQVREGSSSDQGARSAVTGGRQMDGFVTKIADLMMQAGVPKTSIYDLRKRELPGYFRPTKDWDLVVVTEGSLLAAIEFKSQVGPSFGNNCNNRTEEALGNAVDLWTAYREGAFRTSPMPWVGYLFLLEDSPRSKSPVRMAEPHFPIFPEFKDASYAKRYELLCRRLVRERHYSGAAFLMSERSKAYMKNNYTEPADDLNGTLFLNQLLRHVANPGDYRTLAAGKTGKQ